MNKQAAWTSSFDLGKVVITRGANDLCERNSINYIGLLLKHASGDFGTVGHFDDCELTDHDLENGALATDDGLKLNSIAVRINDGMILSIYSASKNNDSTIWIITMLAKAETYTTILVPEEY